MTKNRTIGAAAKNSVKPEIKKVLSRYDKVFNEEYLNEKTPWKAGISVLRLSLPS
ncbi:hypothetical protein R5W60_21335 (plasmid) [Brucella pseudintermedia]|uniref:hypothetical protein n=1 Tax=Brucella pseudintermedia TaxID=370111 RepID=UPI002AC92049|nr:hypothetical protein [Brucella pseudintermedia]WPM83011.1 hypothetical protein R5W60_21335 [Brucella pseudintermedia]